MEILDPQQELFIALKLEIEKLSYAVYDGALPPADTPYPFVYLGDFRQNDTVYKNAVSGTVFPTIHIWHNNIKQRGTVSKMLLNIKAVLYGLKRTNNYSWLIKNVNTQIISDDTTNTPLLHGVIEADCIF